jgi:hypothetical protein
MRRRGKKKMRLVAAALFALFGTGVGVTLVRNGPLLSIEPRRDVATASAPELGSHTVEALAPLPVAAPGAPTPSVASAQASTSQAVIDAPRAMPAPTATAHKSAHGAVPTRASTPAASAPGAAPPPAPVTPPAAAPAPNPAAAPSDPTPRRNPAHI